MRPPQTGDPGLDLQRLLMQVVYDRDDWSARPPGPPPLAKRHSHSCTVCGALPIRPGHVSYRRGLIQDFQHREP